MRTKGSAPSINFEAFEGRRGRIFTKDEKQFLEAVSWINDALRLTLQLREELLLGCLEGRDPAHLERIGERAISTAEKAGVMLALESSDPEMWKQIQGEQR